MRTKRSSLFYFNIVAITILSCVANIALAQSTTTAATSSVQATTTVPMSTQETEVQTVQSPESGLSMQVQVRITNLLANMSNRLEAAITRLQTILIRIESRAVKLKSEGYDVSIVETHIADAHISLTRAKELIDGIDKYVADVVTSQKPRDSWGALRERILNIKLELLNVKLSLRSAVGSMKTASPVAATTTTTVSTTTATTSTAQ